MAESGPTPTGNGLIHSKADHQAENLKQNGDFYEPSQGHLRSKVSPCKWVTTRLQTVTEQEDIKYSVGGN